MWKAEATCCVDGLFLVKLKANQEDDPMSCYSQGHAECLSPVNQGAIVSTKQNYFG